MNVSTSWFENYIVRYLIGTIIGSICCILIISAIYDPVNIQVPLSESINKISEGKIDSTLFLILSLFGLLFCYISSTPITIIHAARMLGALPARETLQPKYMWILWWGIILLTIVSLGISALLNYSPFWLGFVICIPALYILFAQWAPLLATLNNLGKLSDNTLIQKVNDFLNKGSKASPGEFKRYYLSLAKKRVKNDSTKDLRSSYSHLREHSNSIFIVLLELSLAALIVLLCLTMSNSTWGTRSIATVLLLLLWMTPTVFVWGIANSLEGSLEETSDTEL